MAIKKQENPKETRKKTETLNAKNETETVNTKKETTKKSLVKNKVIGTKEVQKIRDAIKTKPSYLFRGRFGQRKIRKISKEKWQKWRYPRGNDIKFQKEDGNVPEPGFGTPKWIRHRHPSGFMEKIVHNASELAQYSKEEDTAIRIARTVGKRKRIEILEKAIAMGLKVLN